MEGSAAPRSDLPGPVRALRVRCLGLVLASATVVQAQRPTIEDHVLPPSGVQFERLSLADLPIYVPHVEHRGTVEQLRRKDVVGELRIATGLDLHERGHAALPAPLPRVSCRFEHYSAVDHEWLLDLIAWFRREIRRLGVSYHAETWDCDNFSLALNAFADLAQLRSERRDPPRLIGRLIVAQHTAWGGTPAGGIHEVVIFRSGRAWWVCEPQSGAVIPLTDYPNRRYIQEVLFN